MANKIQNKDKGYYKQCPFFIHSCGHKFYGFNPHCNYYKFPNFDCCYCGENECTAIESKYKVREKVFLLGFMKRFTGQIRDNKKQLTNRPYRKDGKKPESGQILRMYTGLRTKNAERIFNYKETEPRCTGVWHIAFNKYKNLGLSVRTNFFIKIFGLSTNELFLQNQNHQEYIFEFARLDGWQRPGQMFEYIKNTHGFPFYGNTYYWGKR